MNTLADHLKTRFSETKLSEIANQYRIRQQHYRIARENLNQYRNGVIAMLCDLAVNTPDASLETLADIRTYLDHIEAALKLAKGEL